MVVPYRGQGGFSLNVLYPGIANFAKAYFTAARRGPHILACNVKRSRLSS